MLKKRKNINFLNDNKIIGRRIFIFVQNITIIALLRFKIGGTNDD